MAVVLQKLLKGLPLTNHHCGFDMIQNNLLSKRLLFDQWFWPQDGRRIAFNENLSPLSLKLNIVTTKKF
jgi:hypothetical protein